MDYGKKEIQIGPGVAELKNCFRFALQKLAAKVVPFNFIFVAEKFVDYFA